MVFAFKPDDIEQRDWDAAHSVVHRIMGSTGEGLTPTIARAIATARDEGRAEQQEANRALMAERENLISTKREQLAAMQKRVEAAERAENEAKDCFWAIYPEWVEMKGHGITTEAARTKLVERLHAAEAAAIRKGEP